MGENGGKMGKIRSETLSPVPRGACQGRAGPLRARSCRAPCSSRLRYRVGTPARCNNSLGTCTRGRSRSCDTQTRSRSQTQPEFNVAATVAADYSMAFPPWPMKFMIFRNSPSLMCRAPPPPSGGQPVAARGTMYMPYCELPRDARSPARKILRPAALVSPAPPR